MAKKASITDIAKQLGLSVSTISRALNGHDDISEATKARVWELAKELNYQPNHLAAALRKGRSNMLGLIVPHINGYFFPSVMDGIEAVASKAGFNVMMCQSNEDVRREKKNIEALLNAQVEGILVSMSRTTHEFQHFEKVQQQGIPLVFFDRMPDLANVNAVILDDYQGAYQAVKHLVEQGCTRIAHFAGPQHMNTTRNRHLGYMDALRAHGLSVDEQLVYWLPNSSHASGEAGMKELLKLPERPDAIFSSYDFPAAGAMMVLHEHNIRVPEDMAVAGFSNEPFTALTQPRLTSVDQRGEQMGESAVQLFLQMRKRTENFPAQRIVLKPKLLIRDSSLQLEVKKK
ncbi:LacI family DNA-binding transcriptional regulator [Hymenobacter cavernae]|uniref:LacI family transcriptional regulator n=1 Tax=Hymenobacter cavernae TaxID=2044852 RepID=A0ABQ1U409_9BACT|nr:LacI family DNA-binding transcriptional regulator [Hymenobacter cavernae]GGF10374.1 LacI family transcriptional regulator [Hymenobacter cavernae]